MTMKIIDIFYQGQGVRDVEFIEIDSEQTFGSLRATLIERHGLTADVLLFLEDADDPIDELLVVCDHVGSGGIKAHIHTCRRVKVEVTFNGRTVHHTFGPGTTVARVKSWAAEGEFKMTPAEAGEHVLQITGTHDRPAPGTHLGSLVACPHCQIAFNLVPDQRVNGAPEVVR
jgi:hypothetical protein